MKKYKYIGNQEQADVYFKPTPIIGKTYNACNAIADNTVDYWAECYPEEWQLVEEEESSLKKEYMEEVTTLHTQTKAVKTHESMEFVAMSSIDQIEWKIATVYLEYDYIKKQHNIFTENEENVSFSDSDIEIVRLKIEALKKAYKWLKENTK